MNLVSRDASISGDLPGPKPTLTNTAWHVDGTLNLREWLNYGRHLGALGRGVAWWIGDWLRYGSTVYGERYARAARITGYDAQSLMNMSYVASRFEPSRRRPGLSWSHHAELAALAPDEQEHWLDRAEQHRMSVHALRLEVRTSRRITGKAAEAAPHPHKPHVDANQPQLICPHCKCPIEVERRVEAARALDTARHAQTNTADTKTCRYKVMQSVSRRARSPSQLSSWRPFWACGE
jgi:hypothetical protein